MQIQNISNQYSPMLKGSASRVSTPVEHTQAKDSENTKNNNTKKIALGIGATLILLGVVFRKKIKQLFEYFKTPKKSEPPKPPEPPTPPMPPKPPVVDEAVKNQELLSKYRKMVKETKPFPSNGSEEEKAAWRTHDEAKRKLLNELCDKNISLVEKKEFSLDPNVDVEAKREYLEKIKTHAFFNTASRNDCFDMYEKYADRYWINEDTGASFIRSLMVIANEKVGGDSNHIANRFLDIAEKVALRDPKGMRDASAVRYVYETFDKTLDEATTLRFIELMKKISFQQIDGFIFEQRINHLFKDNSKLNQAVKELKEILKDFPWEDRTKNI